MCFSAKTSITSFLIGWFCSIFLIFRNKEGDRLFGFIFLWVNLMQLLEYLMWIDQKCEKLNNIASQLAWFQNIMQPLIGFIVIFLYIFKGKTFKERNKKSLIPIPILLIAFSLYAIYFIFWIIKNKPYKTNFCTKPCGGSCNNHYLQWPWTTKFDKKIWVFYFAACLLFLITSIKNKAGLFLGVFLILTAIISSSIMPFKNSFGSSWCVFSIAGPLLKIIIPVKFFSNPNTLF